MLPQDTVLVLEVIVVEGRRLSGGTNESLSLSAPFTVEVQTPNELVASESEITERMSAIGNSKSEENSRFSTALGPNMEEEPSEAGEAGVNELSKLAKAVQTEGVIVLSVDAPKVVENAPSASAAAAVPETTTDRFASWAEPKPSSAQSSSAVLVALVAVLFAMLLV
jgi:hypothetical protein